jgi:hypothetical protein
MSNEKVFKLRTKQIKVAVSGKFALDRNLQDAKKRNKFRFTNLQSEVPVGSKDRVYFLNNNSELVATYYIDKLRIIFKPDESDIDQHNVMALINHSDVRIESMSSEEHNELVQKGLKRSNPRFILTNLDKKKDLKLSAEKTLVKAQALVFNDKYNSKQLCKLCAMLEIPYSIEETFEKARRGALEQKLSNFVKYSTANAEYLIEIFERIADQELHYYLNLFIKYELITTDNGFYKMKGEHIPIGIDKATVFKYFEENKEKFDYLKSLVDKSIKEEYSNYVTED